MLTRCWLTLTLLTCMFLVCGCPRKAQPPPPAPVPVVTEPPVEAPAFAIMGSPIEVENAPAPTSTEIDARGRLVVIDPLGPMWLGSKPGSLRQVGDVVRATGREQGRVCVTYMRWCADEKRFLLYVDVNSSNDWLYWDGRELLSVDKLTDAQGIGCPRNMAWLSENRVACDGWVGKRSSGDPPPPDMQLRTMTVPGFRPLRVIKPEGMGRDVDWWVSPDGQHIIFATYHGGAKCQLWTTAGDLVKAFDVSMGPDAYANGIGLHPCYGPNLVEWDADGQRFLIRAACGRTLWYDVTGLPSGEVEIDATGLVKPPTYGKWTAPDRRQCIGYDGRIDALVWVSAEGKRSGLLRVPSGIAVKHVGWAPDSDRVWFLASSEGGADKLFIYDVAQDVVIPVAPDWTFRKSDSMPQLVWSPDGTMLAAYAWSEASGRSDNLFAVDVVNRKASNLTPELHGDWTAVRVVGCTRDNRYIIHEMATGDDRAVWITSTDGSRRRDLVYTDESSFHIHWSP